MSRIKIDPSLIEPDRGAHGTRPVRIALDELSLHPENEQIYGPHTAKLADLVESLEQHGQFRPIEVNQKLQIVSGGRRYMAAKQLGWKTIACSIRTDADDELGALRVIVLDNAYRTEKTLAMRNRERIALQKMYDARQVTKERLEILGDVQGFPRSEKPSEMLAHAAGMSGRTARRVDYLMNARKAEEEIRQAEATRLIDMTTADELRETLHEKRAALEQETKGAREISDDMRRKIAQAAGDSEERVRGRYIDTVQHITSAARILADSLDHFEWDKATKWVDKRRMLLLAQQLDRVRKWRPKK